MKQIVAISGSPRTGWNTDLLVREAARGAESRGAAVTVINLFSLEPYTGCVSCFGCKTPQNAGRCIQKDGLTPVLEKIREADGLILGSPIYLGEVTAQVRALYERLVFQYITYNVEQTSYNTRKIPVILIFTSNCSEDSYAQVGYDRIVAGYKGTLEHFLGPVKTLICGDTLQVDDYGKYNWTMFHPAEKRIRHETVFPNEKKAAFSLGAEMVS
jgi:multimeric flavodoxin WrbA